MRTHNKILLGLVLGAATGVASKMLLPGSPAVAWLADYVANPAGQVFLRLLLMTVVLGGIQRIGAVAGRLVPFMCGLYLIAGLAVIAVNMGAAPEILRLIVRSAFEPSQAPGAFVGGAAGWAFLRGMQRALFSNEAGQGSAPIAHCAARTNEPVREGVVAGLEPFVDTLCVCTITALVILLSGVWNREPEAVFSSPPAVRQIQPGVWTLGAMAPPASALVAWKEGDTVFAVLDGDIDPQRGSTRQCLTGRVEPAAAGGGLTIAWDSIRSETPPRLAGLGLWAEYKGATLTAHAFDRVFP